MMQNKTIHRLDLIDRSKAQSLQKNYDSIDHKAKNTSSRIFEVPSFMFSRKDEAHHLKRVSIETLNAFRPKLEVKQRKEASSGNKRVKDGANERVKQAKKRMEEERNIKRRLDQIIEDELNQFRKEKRAYISVDSDQLKREIRAEQFANKSIQSEQQVSPYAKYNPNAFPKKDLRALITKQKSLNPGREDLGLKLKCSIRQKIQEIESRFAASNPNMLEVMTIYSIKQSQHPPFFKKKQRYFNPQRSIIIPQILPKDTNHIEEIKQDIHYDKIYHRKIYSYMTFLLKVSFSNNIPIRNIALAQRPTQHKIKVFVGNGNNRYLLVALLKRRFWLEITNKITAQTKFVWTQNSIREVHASQKSYNQYIVWEADKQEKEKEKGQHKPVKPGIRIKINTMKKLNPENDDESTEEPKIGIRSVNLLQTSTVGFDQNPSAQALTVGRSKFKAKIKDQLRKQYNRKLFMSSAKGERADRLLQGFKITIKKQLQPPSCQQIQTISNHVPHNSFIGSKKALFYTMEHYYRHVKRIDPFTIIPRTYHFKSPNDDTYSLFLQNQKQAAQRSIWIVKPGECTNRGNGISIMRANEVTRKLLKKEQHPNGQPKTTIVQSYITDPLLYCGRKFDIRHYMMITIINGSLKAYWYSEGYIRTSSEPFSLQDLTNPFIHLTNDAIQKNSEKYGKYELGNKLSYQELQRYLDSTYPKMKISFRQEILLKMKEIARDIIQANYRSLDRDRRVNNFQIFGLDFMLDRRMNPWLIEVNANPCLQISCPLLSRIIPMMVQQSLRLGLDPLLLPPSHYPPNQRYYLADNFLSNLKYELIFDELQQMKEEEGELPPLNYHFAFDEPEDEYENEGAEIDLAKLLD